MTIHHIKPQRDRLTLSRFLHQTHIFNDRIVRQQNVAPLLAATARERSEGSLHAPPVTGAKHVANMPVEEYWRLWHEANGDPDRHDALIMSWVRDRDFRKFQVSPP